MAAAVEAVQTNTTVLMAIRQSVVLVEQVAVEMGLMLTTTQIRRTTLERVPQILAAEAVGRPEPSATRPPLTKAVAES